jgi:anti-anti-sigma regulatory factor
MMISVPGEWDSYKLDQLHASLEPAYTSQHIVINLSGARHVTDTLLAALLELRGYRDAKKLEPAVILVNSAFVRKLLSMAGFDSLFRVYDAVELLVPKAA